MKYIYTVYDSKAEVYLAPFFMRAKGEAIRAFVDMANDSKTQIGAHPEDFTLFEIGTFDDRTGVLVSHEAKISCGLGSDFFISVES